jgi:hypothetical protein
MMFAMFAWLSRHVAQVSPTFYSLLDNGAPCHPIEYGLYIVMMLIAAVFCFAGVFRTDRGQPSARH